MAEECSDGGVHVKVIVNHDGSVDVEIATEDEATSQGLRVWLDHSLIKEEG